MWSAGSVLVCALSVLGRSESSMPRIELIDVAPPGVSANAEAFVERSTKTISVLTSSNVFRDAASSRGGCNSASMSMRKLASILAHEEWHVRHGPDERKAYHYQLVTLIRLGVPPGAAIYQEVQASMLSVLEARRRGRPDRVLASR